MNSSSQGPDGGDGQYQHAAQLWLMRTPSPCEIDDVHDDRKQETSTDQVESSLSLESISNNATTLNQGIADKYGEHTTAKRLESNDPRCYFISRRNSMKTSGR
jgi:hypothetical protein